MTIYTVTKLEILTGKETDYGNCGYDDVQAITKGYIFNGLFYERKNGKYIYIVTEKTE